MATHRERFIATTTSSLYDPDRLTSHPVFRCVHELLAIEAATIERIPGADRCKLCGAESPFDVTHADGCPVRAFYAKLESVFGD